MIDQKTRLDAMYNQGRADAQALQGKAAGMDGTQLNGEAQKIPDFQAAKKTMNMLNRPVGFVCKSTAGRVVKLLQVYDSDTYPGEPEELPAQWGFVWSKDPAHAKPFVALSTSPYMTGDCCIEGGVVYASTIDNNVHAPSAYPQGWRRADEPAPEPQPEPQPEAQPWKQPTGGHDAYKKGDKVAHKGKTWVSTVDANVWEPGTYGWEEVT